jgi:hypothetical protein
VGALRLRLAAGHIGALVAAGALTVLAAYVSVRMGATISVGALFVAAFFVVTVIGFVGYPHLAVAGTVLLFALLPTLKVFISPTIGPVKDLVIVAAGTAAVILYAFERRRPDRRVLALILLLLALYAVNPGGGHGVAWAQGVRLVGEPLVLLFVGLTLPQPQRVFRYAVGALVVTCCLVAAYGILQQLVGPARLVGWGYSYNQQVRIAYGHLRSFGTLDDPFDYAQLLSLGVAGVIFSMRRKPLAWVPGMLIMAGLAASLVRTSILFLVGLAGLIFWRWGRGRVAVFIAAATLVAGGVTLAESSGSQSHKYAILGSSVTSTSVGGSADLILNGRVSAWTAALGSNPAAWILGRGVGTVGTAAQRATYTFAPSSSASPPQSQAVDSGYLATVADVGFVGLAVLLALFGRLLALAVAAARGGKDAGWFALGVLVVMLIAATTGASFTSFPNAFLGMLVIGIALSASREESSSARGAPGRS